MKKLDLHDNEEWRPYIESEFTYQFDNSKPKFQINESLGLCHSNISITFFLPHPLKETMVLEGFDGHVSDHVEVIKYYMLYLYIINFLHWL
jgi:hypothetical protein